MNRKFKYFNYAVGSAGKTVKGSYTGRPIDVDRMTQVAAWIAQEAACEEGWEFNLDNFSIAVQPIP
jgi:hypothetical protein